MQYDLFQKRKIFSQECGYWFKPSENFIAQESVHNFLRFRILYSSSKIQNPSGAHRTRQPEVLHPGGNATSEGSPACTIKNEVNNR